MVAIAESSFTGADIRAQGKGGLQFTHACFA